MGAEGFICTLLLNVIRSFKIFCHIRGKSYASLCAYGQTTGCVE